MSRSYLAGPTHQPNHHSKEHPSQLPSRPPHAVGNNPAQYHQTQQAFQPAQHQAPQQTPQWMQELHQSAHTHSGLSNFPEQPHSHHRSKSRTSFAASQHTHGPASLHSPYHSPYAHSLTSDEARHYPHTGSAVDGSVYDIRYPPPHRQSSIWAPDSQPSLHHHQHHYHDPQQHSLPPAQPHYNLRTYAPPPLSEYTFAHPHPHSTHDQQPLPHAIITHPTANIPSVHTHHDPVPSSPPNVHPSHHHRYDHPRAHSRARPRAPPPETLPLPALSTSARYSTYTHYQHGEKAVGEGHYEFRPYTGKDWRMFKERDVGKGVLPKGLGWKEDDVWKGKREMLERRVGYARQLSLVENARVFFTRILDGAGLTVLQPVASEKQYAEANQSLQSRQRSAAGTSPTGSKHCKLHEGLAFEGTNTTLIARIEEHLKQSQSPSKSDLAIWMVPFPKQLPDLPSEMVRHIARLSGPSVSRKLQSMSKYHRKLITHDDIVWAEAGHRHFTGGLNEVFWWSFWEWHPDIICAYVSEAQAAFPEDWPRQETLDHAVRRGDIKTVKRLLQMGAHVDLASMTAAVGRYYCPLDGQPPREHPDIMQALFQHHTGVHLDEDGKAIQIALQLAVQGGYLRVIEVIFEHYGKQHHLPGLALLRGAEEGRVDIVRLALKVEDDLNDAQHRVFVEAAMEAALGEGQTEVVRILLGYDQSLASLLLVWAARIDSLPMVRMACGVNADVHHDEDAALRAAVANNHIDIVKFFLTAGADIHARDECALAMAAAAGYEGLVKILLEAGSNVHHRDGNALFAAAGCGHAGTVEVLLRAGANVHAGNEAALRIATVKRFVEVTKVLFKGGASFMTSDGQSLLVTAAVSGDSALVQVYLEAGADPRWRRYTAIRCAALERYIDTVKMLLDAIAYEEEGAYSALGVALIEHNVVLLNEVLQAMAVARGLDATLEALPEVEGELRLEAVITAAKAGQSEAVKVLVASIRKMELPRVKTVAVLGQALEEAATGGYDAIVTVLGEEVGHWGSD
ncbi:hypothetical protein HDV00_010298 [Rhizophlyctis rosea]|nr:hypothetical protein HDV00_010298 [Rhizophlyctis rosea]